MADPVPAGSDVSAGTYACTNCGNEIGGCLNQASSAMPEVRQRRVPNGQRRRQ